MYYYDVAPLTKIVNNDGLLTYSSSDRLMVGEIVEVMLRGRKKIAIIVNKTQEPTYETKEIIRSLGNKYRLDNAHLKLADFMANRYFCTLGEALSAIMPLNVFIKRRENSNSGLAPATDTAPRLTQEQEEAFSKILKEGKKKPSLLFGVTGSGKTEIYLRIIERVLAENKSAIFLVPEISLTPQTKERVINRFGNIARVIHSNLLESERARIWKEAEEGKIKVIVGPRSALFAPLKNIGAIIIDEAHEESYKQEQTPRYQSVEVAEKLAEFTNSYLILGSATPSIEQYHKAQVGGYNLISMNNRIVQKSMPEVEIVDMRNEFHARNFSVFSETLQEEIRNNLINKKQILLFVNRRGMSTFVACRDCGHVVKCPDCDVSMTYHLDKNKLLCHHCSKSLISPVVCPVCSSIAIKYFGTGTERVENEARKLFPTATIARMDGDSTVKTGSHERLFKDLKEGKIDIIIGTQMITKGWDIGNINLIGIISADPMINLPIFDAESRALSMLLQVAGRTGRGATKGKVILQTYNPELAIFNNIKTHDYVSFYKNEIENRRLLHYPPFAKFIELLYNNQSEEIAKAEATKVGNKLKDILAENKIDCEINILPSPILKLHGKYRWQITLKLPVNEKNNYRFLYNIFMQILTKDWIIIP